MKSLRLVIWTNSGLGLALAEFPWLIARIRGTCSRRFLEKSFGANIAISDDLVLNNRLLTTLSPVRKQENLRMIGDVLRAQPRDYDLKIAELDCRWFDEGNNVHKLDFVRAFHLASRTVEHDYELSVRGALFKVFKICENAGLLLHNQKPSFLVSSEDIKEDELYNILGTQLWSNNPLSQSLYGAVECVVTNRGVKEYKVVKLG